MPTLKEIEQHEQNIRVAEAYRRAGIRMVVFSIVLATGMILTLY